MPSSIKVALLDSENTVATLSNNQPIVLELNTPDTHVTTTSLPKLGWIPLLVRVQVSSGTTPDCDFYFTRDTFSVPEYKLLGTSVTRSYGVTIADTGVSISAALYGSSSGYTITGMWGYNYVKLVSESSGTILTNSDHTAIIPFHGPGVEYIDKNIRRCYMSVPLPIFDSSTQLSVNAANSFCIEQATAGNLLSPKVVLGTAIADWDTGAYTTHANLLADTNQINVLRKDATNLLQSDGIVISATGLTWDPTHYGFLYSADTGVGKNYNKFVLADGAWYGNKDVSRHAVNGSYSNEGGTSRSFFLAITFEQWAYYDGTTITRE